MRSNYERFLLVQTQELFTEDFSSRNVVFVMSAIGIAGKLAAVDGPINLMEVSGFLNIFNIPEEERTQKLQLFFSAAKDGSEAKLLSNFIRKSYPDSNGLLRQLMDKLIRIADSDNFIHEEEYGLIKETADTTGIGEGYLQGALWRYYTTPKMPVESMLKLSRKPTSEEIKNNYRKLSREIHPDVYRAGKYSFLSQLAAGRFSAITDAYRRLNS